jgi:inosine-uridine nucleoside N-ribohydrolase
VVVTGGRLTDIADAYLVDPTVADRVVVVSSLGTSTSSGGVMAQPNGEMDPWADAIVTSRFRYVQVSAYYDQLTDVPSSRLGELPENALGNWIRAKQPQILNLQVACDQVAVAAVALPTFTVSAESVSPSTSVEAGATAGPNLSLDPSGRALLVTKAASALASARFWELLLAR